MSGKDEAESLTPTFYQSHIFILAARDKLADCGIAGITFNLSQ